MTEIRQMPGTPTTCRVRGDSLTMTLLAVDGDTVDVTVDRSAGDSLVRWLGVSRVPVSRDEIAVAALFGALGGALIGVTATFLLIVWMVR